MQSGSSSAHVCMEDGVRFLDLRRKQSRVCSSEEVTVVVKVFAVLLLLVVIVSVLGTYAGQQLWSWNPAMGEEEEDSMVSQHPINLTHCMSDDELFRRAVNVSKMGRYRRSRVSTPKIAFMFLARGGLPLSALWEKYFESHHELYSIYVHSHPSYQPDYPSSSVFYERQIPSQVLAWGGLSMVDAERRLLANALLDVSNQRFVLLSETCIPLFDFSFTYRYLMRSKYSFVETFDDPGPGARGRYDPKLQPEISIQQWRKGTQWFEMSRQVAVVIVNETACYARFHELGGGAIVPDEHYIPTVLTITAPHLIANRSLTWTMWKKDHQGHPATFGKDDMNGTFPEQINRDRNCSYNDRPSAICFLFARKFATSALEPLLESASAYSGSVRSRTDAEDSKS
ncbi:glycosyltransferase BC10-like [Musa acuminata AAA Group]|uniref:glycosyltransferase BC10-like n=1 Tax=Musa acuminata AAA Group TaxID=214697 RepID=UPI0031CEED2F